MHADETKAAGITFSRPELDVSDEPVAMPQDGLDETRIGRIVAQLLPGVFDALRQDAFRHDHAIPDLREELGLLDELTMFAHHASEASK